MDALPIVLLYILASVVIIFGIMFIIRRKRDKDAGRSPSHKIKDLKAEETEDKTRD